ncbi:MAG TPA: hypothetical protein VK447_08185 [Myxococcaceae bacterium]|nr:hypothetical protein [Myxococcaceae bacterium]
MRTQSIFVLAMMAALAVGCGKPTPQLAFTVQPTDSVAGASISPSFQVAVVDDNGKVMKDQNVHVTISLDINPNGGSLLGDTTLETRNGVATFSLAVDKAGPGYTLSARAPELSKPAKSTAFLVSPAAPSQLAIAAMPAEGDVDSGLAPVRVHVKDAYGNVTVSTPELTVALQNANGATLRGVLTQKALNGLAVFPDLNVDLANEGYALTFTSPGLTPITTGLFKVKPGTARSLVFTTQPQSGSAGTALSATVTARDQRGNVATGFTGPVTLALGNNPGSATLGGTLTVNAVSGVANFANLTVNKVGVGYSMSATSGTLNAASQAFEVTPAVPAALAFATQPGSTVAGQAIPASTVQVLDVFGNVVSTGNGLNIAVSLVNANGAVLQGNTNIVSTQGVATLSGLSIEKAGQGYALRAESGTLTSATSSAFAVAAAAPARLAITGQPTDAVAGVDISPNVTVAIVDTYGNVAPVTDAVSVRLSPASGLNRRHAADAAFFGTTTRNAVAGVATFSDLSVRDVGAYVLNASSGNVMGATSATFNIRHAAAAQLVFTTQPANAVAGVANPAAVTAVDAFGNVATGFTGAVSVSIQGETVSGTTTVNAVAGVASFADINVRKAGTGYVLNAAASGLNGSASSSFDVAHAAATKLVVVAQPADLVAGGTLSTVTVQVRDAFDNVATASTDPVTLDLTPGTGASLTGTTTVNAVAGVASFSDLGLTKAGTGYTLAAVSGTLTNATTASFDVTHAAAARLAFSGQPSNAEAGVSVSPAVAVTVEDAYANVVTNYAGDVTVELAFSAGAPELFGTKTVAAASGVASFSDLSVRKAGTLYALTAASGTLTGATSATFDIRHADAAALAITTEPSNTTAGAAISPDVVVELHDAFANVVTSSTASVSIEIQPGAGATLLGTKTVDAVAGVATFAGLSLRKAGSGYVLDVASSGLPTVATASFNVSPAAEAKLAFTTQPGDVTAGDAFAPAVTVLDEFDNTVTGSTTSITVALNPGSGGTLLGTTTAAASGGVAAFTGLSIQRAGAGYGLVASSGTLTSANSATFTVSPAAAAKLAITAQPSNAIAGAAVGSVAVTVQDAFDNTVTSSTATITVALAANPGTGTLSGTASRDAVSGVATFEDLSIEKTGTGYTLAFSSGSLTGATSSAFNVAPGADTQLAFIAQPGDSNVNVAINPAVRVVVRDQYGNQTASTAAVTVALLTKPNGATLGGTLTQSAVGGVVSFTDLTVDTQGAGYQLQATSPGLTPADSVTFAGKVPSLIYTDPVVGAAKLALVRNPATTATTVVLDLVAVEDVTGYGVGMNLPLDGSKVRPNAAMLTAGTALHPGTGTVAAAAALPSSGPLANVLVSGQSQKAAGGGAVATDTLVPGGSVLYTLRLDVKPSAGAGTVFSPNVIAQPKFRALLRDRLGNDVVSSGQVAIGSLSVQLN